MGRRGHGARRVTQHADHALNRQAPPDRFDGDLTDMRGLSASDVAARLTRFGPNRIVASDRRGWLAVMRDTVGDPMIWFLLGTAALFFVLGDYTETLVLVAALVPIIGMDAYLHRRTQASTSGLLSRMATRARVIRDGTTADVPAEDLVPGDLVIVEAGTYFPADGLIVAGDALQADESTLTGEALPVRKLPLTDARTGRDAAPIDGQHWGMAGTRLLTGEARMRVVWTGADTLYGEIARLSQGATQGQTPLQSAISQLVRMLLLIALALCVALAVVRYVQGYGLVDALLSAVTLAIAALPEEFPVVFSFFLGLGVYRLAKRQALVRRAVVVENIGRVSCICTDKTGTLTEGRLALDIVEPADEVARETLLGLAATASRAETADPLDAILLEIAAPVEGQVEAVFPFTEDRLREVAAVRLTSGQILFAMKGAPETVIDMSTMPDEQKAEWRGRTRDLAATGHKVIGVAARTQDAWTGSEPGTGFDFAGLLAFSDPVRPGVPEAVASAQRAGIRVIMVTGDHRQTARAIAAEIGIGGGEPRVVDGTEMAAQLDAGVADVAFDVVARCTPAQKRALVDALRQSGELVAVTGDGVNDAPALRGADVGIAMGERGTQSTREVAAIVLLDDNFATIVRAIAEGRQLFTNLRLSFAYLLMLHAPLVITAALIPLLGYPLLYLPIHIVWLEIIIHPTAMLVFQNLPEDDVLSRERTTGRPRFFSLGQAALIGLVGAIATAFVVGGFILNLDGAGEIAHARAMALAALVTAGVGMTVGLTRLRSRAAWAATLLPVVSVAVALNVPALARLLHVAPIHPVDWLAAGVGGLLVAAGALAFGRRLG